MEVGIKTENSFVRKEVSSIESVVRKYNGIADIFFNPYKGRETITYFIFDLDGAESFSDNEKLCKYFSDYRHFHVFSGKKGFHFYLSIKPISFELAKSAFRGFIQFMRDELELKSWDYQTSTRLVSGHGLIRVPNTIHINGRWCTYVPCHVDFEKVIELANTMQDPVVHEGKEYDITVHVGYTSSGKPVSIPTYDVGDVDLRIVSELVRPCVFASSLGNPNHFVRTTLVTELAWIGYDEETIVRILSKMGWKNFNEHVTRYHVRKIMEKVKQGRLYPPSCQTLHFNGISCSSCQYRNWWFDYENDRKETDF
ncbi:MAG: hypothetical protein QXF40_01945 [Metallosphaera sp.]